MPCKIDFLLKIWYNISMVKSDVPTPNKFKGVVKMFDPYDRKFVSQFLALKANCINPAFAFGRLCDKPGSIVEEFTLAFFLRCTDEQIKLLNSFVKPDEKEVLVEFFQDVPFQSPSIMTEDKMKDFDFSIPWKAYRFCTSWDEERNVPQEILVVNFMYKG